MPEAILAAAARLDEDGQPVVSTVSAGKSNKAGPITDLPRGRSRCYLYPSKRNRKPRAPARGCDRSRQLNGAISLSVDRRSQGELDVLWEKFLGGLLERPLRLD
jgi:hypothetical protein